jgi:nucleotidyltransferase/DNA polymerase involved in DNA repair
MARCVLFAEVPGFYAAVERAQDPALATRPVIVGGDPRKRGRVQAATPDALAAGVELDMPVLEALQRCPGARAVRTNMRRYREVSRRLLAVLRRVHPPLEPFGLGAAYGELAGAAADPEALARAMHAAVRDALGLPLRVGLASGKFLARLAAQEVGGDGVRRIDPGEEARFLAPLEATRLDGVGRKTAATLAALGAHTIGDVVRLGRQRLQGVFGTHGLRIYAFATGADGEPVRASRHPQTLSRESTVQGEPLDVAVLLEQLGGLAQELETELRRQGLAAGKVALRVRYGDGPGVATRTRTLPAPAQRAFELAEVASHLLARTQAGARPVRGLGLQLSALAPAGDRDRQLDLFRTQV